MKSAFFFNFFRLHRIGTGKYHGMCEYSSRFWMVCVRRVIAVRKLVCKRRCSAVLCAAPMAQHRYSPGAPPVAWLER